MMQLRTSPASPFGRKVLILAAETGLSDRIAVVETSTADPTSGLSTQNPLSKIPALITDDGWPVFDSRVICEYLDGLHDGTKLIPAPGPARWRALRQQAVGDGIMDAAVLRRTLSQQPDAQPKAHMDRQRAAVTRACDLLEAEVETLDGPLTIGHIAIAAALGYLDLRFASEDWRPGRPRLAAWHAEFARRPSYAATDART